MSSVYNPRYIRLYTRFHYDGMGANHAGALIISDPRGRRLGITYLDHPYANLPIKLRVHMDEPSHLFLNGHVATSDKSSRIRRSKLRRVVISMGRTSVGAMTEHHLWDVILFGCSVDDHVLFREYGLNESCSDGSRIIRKQRSQPTQLAEPECRYFGPDTSVEPDLNLQAGACHGLTGASSDSSDFPAGTTLVVRSISICSGCQTSDHENVVMRSYLCNLVDAVPYGDAQPPVHCSLAHFGSCCSTRITKDSVPSARQNQFYQIDVSNTIKQQDYGRIASLQETEDLPNRDLQMLFRDYLGIQKLICGVESGGTFMGLDDDKRYSKALPLLCVALLIDRKVRKAQEMIVIEAVPGDTSYINMKNNELFQGRYLNLRDRALGRGWKLIFKSDYTLLGDAGTCYNWVPKNRTNGLMEISFKSHKRVSQNGNGSLQGSKVDRKIDAAKPRCFGTVDHGGPV
ncbi:hypothetical protein DFH29DRAFT_880287 [Suillus ampliporus]|nr:hypothetical protein DFH29DRAFT_880287 [Suillus ampliporus]